MASSSVVAVAVTGAGSVVSGVAVTSGRLSGMRASVPLGRIGSAVASEAIVVGAMVAGSAGIALGAGWWVTADIVSRVAKFPKRNELGA